MKNGQQIITYRGHDFLIQVEYTIINCIPDSPRFDSLTELFRFLRKHVRNNERRVGKVEDAHVGKCGV